jgi:NAD(P)-dependent dehydrogenase (short-subunit alcohol dehydrogenase family)
MSHNILITGASRGIGAATALLAASRGWNVCVNFHANEQAAQQIVEEITALGVKAIAVQGDVGVEKDIVQLFQRFDEEFGSLDALVNNAGILDKQMPLAEMSAERMSRIFTTNILGSFLCAREAVRRMSTNTGGKGGVIINVSSGAARLGSPNEFIDYAASKGAIDTMTIGLSKEVADQGIRVNAVRPGLVDTDMQAASGEPDRAKRMRDAIPMKRAGTVQEIAQTILWLASNEASYLTGSLVDVTGGR